MGSPWTPIAEGLTPDAAREALARLKSQDIEARVEAGRVLVAPDDAADAEAVLADAAAAEAEAAAAPDPHAHGAHGHGAGHGDAREVLGERQIGLGDPASAPAPAPAAAPGSESDGPGTAGLLVMLGILGGLALLVMKSCR